MKEYLQDAYDYWMSHKDTYNIMGVDIYKFNDSDKYFNDNNDDNCDWLDESIKGLKPEDFNRKVLMAKPMLKDEWMRFTNIIEDEWLDLGWDDETATVLVIVLSNTIDNKVTSAVPFGPKVYQEGSWENRALNYLLNYLGKRKTEYDNNEVIEDFAIVEYGLTEDNEIQWEQGITDEDGTLGSNPAIFIHTYPLTEEGLKDAFRYLHISFDIV